jgi:hypothetical protein
MTKPLTTVVVIGLAYIAGVGVLYVREAGILAAYLTMPAWFVVGGLSLQLTSLTPDSALDATLFSWSGNFVGLVVSAALNVAGVYLVVRRLSKA